LFRHTAPTTRKMGLASPLAKDPWLRGCERQRWRWRADRLGGAGGGFLRPTCGRVIAALGCVLLIEACGRLRPSLHLRRLAEPAHAQCGEGATPAASGEETGDGVAAGAEAAGGGGRGGGGGRRAYDDGAEGNRVRVTGAGELADHRPKAFNPVVFFIIAYLSSALAQQITGLLPRKVRPPPSVSLFVIGGLLGCLAKHQAGNSEFAVAIMDFMEIDPHVIFWILLPALLYEDASAVHWHVFQRCCPNALILAVPGVMVNSLLTGCFVRIAFSSIEWTWPAALLLGSILSATDPVAVVGALHSLCAPDKLSSLISGESLFNDGSAVVLFHLFWDLARGEREFEWAYSVVFFVRMALGGPLLALLVSAVVWFWLRKTQTFQIEIIVIITSVYVLFFVAEHEQCKVSGVLAVVCFGFFMASTGHFALDVEREFEHHAVMNFLALLSNEAIFVVAGIVSYRFALLSESIVFRDWVELFMLYFVIHLTRAAVIFLFWPLLRKSGYGVTWKEALICVYGGLRGAVGLAMALLVEHNQGLDEATRQRIAFHTSGIVFGTLLVNGTTITTLYRWLHVYKEAAHHQQLLTLALCEADNTTSLHARLLRRSWFFHNSQVDRVMHLVPKLSGLVEHHVVLDDRELAREIHAVMDEVASNLPQGHVEEYLTKKITASWRCYKNSMGVEMQFVNPFLMGKSHMVESDSNDQEEVELAMAMPCDALALHGPRRSTVDKTHLWRSSARFSAVAPGESPDLGAACSHSADGDELGAGGDEQSRTCHSMPRLSQESSGSLLAFYPGEEQMTKIRVRQRWQWACCKVIAAIHFVRDSKQARQHTKSLQTKRLSSLNMRCSHLFGFVRNDATTMVEIHQTVINAARATYKSMFGARSLNVDAYTILMDSLNIHEEELFKAVNRPTSNFASENLDRERVHELAIGFREAWAHVRCTIGKPMSTVFWIACSLLRVGHWLEACWRLVKRDVEIVFAYVMTQESLLQELEILDDFVAEVKDPMMSVNRSAKREALLGLVREPYDSGMFVLSEHVLLARLLVRAQAHSIENLAHDGIILAEDAEEVLSNVIGPTERALNRYVPTKAQLKAAGSRTVEDYRASCLKSWFMRLIIQIEFHDECWD